MQIVTRRFVRPEMMNHHQSMYAGYISEWITEAAFIAMAGVLGRTDHMVLAAMNEVRISQPSHSGDILEFCYELGKVGTTSVELWVMGKEYLTGQTHCQGKVVFVTVDDEGKKAPHGLSKQG